MDNLIVTASPHITDNVSTRKLMGNVVISLIPCVIASTLIFGVKALLLTVVTTAACVAFEYIWCALAKKKNPVGDLSAVVTGIILAMNLPASLPIWMGIVGAFVAIVLVKQLFGGLGYNFANPALVGRIVLFSGFATDVYKRQGLFRAVLLAQTAGNAAGGAFLDDLGAQLMVGAHDHRLFGLGMHPDDLLGAGSLAGAAAHALVGVDPGLAVHHFNGAELAGLDTVAQADAAKGAGAGAAEQLSGSGAAAHALILELGLADALFALAGHDRPGLDRGASLHAHHRSDLGLSLIHISGKLCDRQQSGGGMRPGVHRRPALPVKSQ